MPSCWGYDRHEQAISTPSSSPKGGLPPISIALICAGFIVITMLSLWRKNDGDPTNDRPEMFDTWTGRCTSKNLKWEEYVPFSVTGLDRIWTLIRRREDFGAKAWQYGLCANGAAITEDILMLLMGKTVLSWELDQLSSWRSHTAWGGVRRHDAIISHFFDSVLDLHRCRLWYTTHKPTQVPVYVLIPSNPSNPSTPCATENCQKVHKDCKRRGEYDRSLSSGSWSIGAEPPVRYGNLRGKKQWKTWDELGDELARRRGLGRVATRAENPRSEQSYYKPNTWRHMMPYPSTVARRRSSPSGSQREGLSVGV
ncbi:hypothetical protein EDB83DRAFT_2317689 [Lactarius deliciosus]|nr:hypothetical protein EDB83DRAFT_2317689 [Lactarius deliciosus]